MSYLKIGDSVVVKQNVHDPDANICIGGWQGRISKINIQENLICIEWDSYTLKRMPSEVIEQSKYNGLDWRRIFLQTDEVEISQSRDTKEDVKSTIDYLNKKYWWFCFGEEGKRIVAVLNKVSCENENDAYNAWEGYLKEVLDFPFNAEVAEPQEKKLSKVETR